MSRRPRTPSPATLAALGLAGALGAAVPAHAQDVAEPALASTPQPQAEPPSVDPPVPTAPLADAPPPPPGGPAEPPPVPAEPSPPAGSPPPPAVAEVPPTPAPPVPVPPAGPGPEAPPGAAAAKPEDGEAADTPQDDASGDRPARRPRPQRRPAERTPRVPARRERPRTPVRTPGDATAPAPQRPSPFASTPAGDDPLAAATRVELEGALLRRFRIPPFLLPIFQAAGTQYGIRWEVLAAINEIETDFGRNLAVSSAGAQGWMQFMPATWKAYGTDANRDGRRDPWNPVDAIFAAARYLEASGAREDLRKAIFAYNHADWYVESVLLRAKLIAELPTALVDGLTGITQGRFPVLGPATVDRVRRVTRGGRTEVEPVARRGAIVFTEPDAPVVAVQDGRVVAVGRSARLGRHVVLEDAFGNRYTYARLSRVARSYPVPHEDARARDVVDRVLPELELPAPPAVLDEVPEGKERLAAHPAREDHGAVPSFSPVPVRGGEVTATSPPRAEPYSDHDRRLLGGLDREDVDLRELRVGAEVIGGTVLGRAGTSPTSGKALVRFEVRPSGDRAPRLDPVPFLDGLRLLQRAGLDRRFGRAGRRSVGQVLLMGKDALRRRVLANEGITINGCMREDVRSGVIDRRVLATLELLAASGLEPTVTSLRCNHGLLTSSGNVSHHSTGTAVDIGAINGVRIEPGTQGPGSVTERTVRRLLTLQGAMAPSQIISLMSFEGAPATLSMPDHDDHIHVGWRPGGDGHPTGRRAADVGTLSTEQWRRVAERLSQVGNPTLRQDPPATGS